MEQIAQIIWDLPLIFFILSSGIFLSIYTFLPQVRFFIHAIKVIVGKYVRPLNAEISNFQAFCNAISAPIGLGSVAGVAIALSVAGPGAIFWMWIAGLLGMVFNLFSISLGIIYRHEDKKRFISGPMYTIKNGLSKTFRPLAIFYAILLPLIALGLGNLFQSNQISSMLNFSWKIPTIIPGLFIAILTAVILFGKLKKYEGIVSSKIAPLFVGLFIVGAGLIIGKQLSMVPAVLKTIVTHAFYPSSLYGGMLAISFKEILSWGLRRAIFSNDAAMGPSAMADGKANDNPMQKGLVGILGPFIDTILVSTITALIILLSGVWEFTGEMQGIELAGEAFTNSFGLTGEIGITIFVTIFAFSTIICWADYGEKSIRFLIGEKGILPYRIIFIGMLLIGPFVPLALILNITDPLIGLILIPNLLANLFLAPKVKKGLQKYRKDLRAGRI